MSVEFRDPVHGTLPFTDAETAVLDSPEFQRLRAIKQLGFADVSFPGATHTRFLHSLGVSHLAGLVFDQIFKGFNFSKPSARTRLRQTVRLGALLHDVGHGPLSHTTEEVMPAMRELGIKVYDNKRLSQKDLRATHEDYTIKYLTDSPLTEVIQKSFSEIDPYYIACLVDRKLKDKDDFFIDADFNFRPILSQMVSSELDVDRMDYLERDSYYTGTNYGKIDQHWLMTHLTYHAVGKDLFLALNRRALYTFDDFLISRHHIHLMVYFHHKPIIYEEMLNRYLTSDDCDFRLPADINEYTKYNDFKLYEHLANSKNKWAQRLSKRNPYRRLIELHSGGNSPKPKKIIKLLDEAGIDSIWASSQARLSKYHAASEEDRAYPIYVVDQFDPWDKPQPIDRSTEIFQRYEGARVIDRIYVAPENIKKSEKILQTLVP